MARVVSAQALLILTVLVPLLQAVAVPIPIGIMVPVHAEIQAVIVVAVIRHLRIIVALRQLADVAVAILTAVHVLARQLHHKDALTSRHQAVQAAGTLILAFVLAARTLKAALHQEAPPAQALHQADLLLHPAPALQATIGCLIPVAGACLMDQPMCQADYLIPTILLT